MSNHNSSFGFSLAPATGTAGDWQRRLVAAAGGGGWWGLREASAKLVPSSAPTPALS